MARRYDKHVVLRSVTGEILSEYDQPMTDHSAEIALLRQSPVTAHRAAADLLECHDATGISLDEWGPVRQLVEEAIEGPILENHV